MGKWVRWHYIAHIPSTLLKGDKCAAVVRGAFSREIYPICHLWGVMQWQSAVTVKRSLSGERDKLLLASGFVSFNVKFVVVVVGVKDYVWFWWAAWNSCVSYWNRTFWWNFLGSRNSNILIIFWLTLNKYMPVEDAMLYVEDSLVCSLACLGRDWFPVPDLWSEYGWNFWEKIIESIDSFHLSFGLIWLLCWR